LTFTVPFGSLTHLSDDMILSFCDPKPARGGCGTPHGQTKIAGLVSSVAPHLTSVDTFNGIVINGTGLFLDSVRFGRTGPISKVECADLNRTQCLVKDPPASFSLLADFTFFSSAFAGVLYIQFCVVSGDPNLHGTRVHQHSESEHDRDHAPGTLLDFRLIRSSEFPVCGQLFP
jgi:hypothetical protein